MKVKSAFLAVLLCCMAWLASAPSALGNGPEGGSSVCAGDTWAATSLEGAPSPRFHPTGVWTGTEMLVWGDGYNTGGRYDPATDTWLPISTVDAPSARLAHTAVWTGTEMLVWGGDGIGDFLNTGGRYDPATDTWVATTLVGAPSTRNLHTAVWTGTEMIIWGGEYRYFDPIRKEYVYPPLNTGGRYCASADP